MIAIDNLKRQMEAKEKEIERFRNEVAGYKAWRDETNAQHKHEERLIMSAFYEIGLEMQSRLVATGGPGGGGGGGGAGAAAGSPGAGHQSWINKARSARSSKKQGTSL